MSGGLFARSPFLQDLLATRMSYTPSGERLPLDSDVTDLHAIALYQQVLSSRPDCVLEIGLAHAVSSLAILTALEEIGGQGRLISIDPFQTAHYRSCGLGNIAHAGLAKRHTLLEEPDWVALPRLLAEGLSPGLAYIDGSHAFEHVMLDAFYVDKLLPTGGVMAFNDCGLEAVDTAMRYLVASRHYDEIDVGLAHQRTHIVGFRGLITRGWRQPSLFTQAVARLRQHKLSVLWRPHQDRYFRKRDDWVLDTDLPLPF